MSRRGFLALLIAIAARPAAAGNQVYEELAASVRASMQASIADRAVPHLNFNDPGDGHRWLNEMHRRLRPRMPDRKLRHEFLVTAHYEAVRNRLPPQLVLGLIEVESGFRKYAVSSAGARGYMQVMPFWIKVIGEPRHNLFHLRTNLRYGCVILRHYLDVEKGDYFRALGRYNGSLGRAEYPNLVKAHWQGKWRYDGPIG